MAVGNGSLGSIRGTIKIDYDGAGVARANKDLTGVGAKGKASGEAMAKASTLMLGAGLAIAGGFALAVNSAANFEKGLSNIKAVSGATAAEMEKIRAKALQLGKDTKFSAGEAASAMEELAKAGLSLDDIMNGAADATVNLAAAGDIALPEAATIASNAMNQFALSAKEMPKVADLIAGAANASAIDVSQFGFSLSQVGAVAHLAGLSFKDTAVAIAELGNAGIVGSDAGTSLKTFLNNLIPTTKNQIKLSKELGLMTKDGTNAFFDQNGKVKSLAEVSQILQNATKGLTKEQKLAAFQTLFGSDAIRAAAVLAEQGADGFNKMAGAMDKVKAADVAKTKMDNLKGSLEQMKGSLETAGIAIGTILLPPLRKIVDGITRVANAFLSLSPSTQKTIIAIVGIAAAVLIVVAVVYKIILVVRVFQAAWIALNISFAVTPIGAIITAIVILVGVIIYLAVKTQFFQTIWSAIWSFFKVIGAWFAGPFAGFFVALWNKIVAIFTAIGSFFAAIWGFIVGIFTFYFNIIKAVVGFFAPLFQAVFGLITSVVRLAFSIIGAIIAVATTIWKATIGTALSFIWNIIQFVIGAIVAYWNFGWNNLLAIIRFVWGFIGPYITAAINAINSVIRAVVGGVLGFLSGAWNRLVSITSAAWGAISSAASSVWNFITGIIRGAVNIIIGIIDRIKAVVDKVRGFFNQLKAAASGGVGSLISFVGGIPGRIIGALGNVASMLYNSGVKIIQGLINGIKNMAGRVKDAVAGVLKQARDLLPFSPAKTGPFSGKGWTLFSGISMMKALITGIQSQASAVRRAMSNTLAGVSASATLDVQAAAGLSGGSTGPRGGGSAPFAPMISVRPIVIADLGNGVRQVVKSTVADEPDLVAASATKGAEYRQYLSPGRGGDSSGR